MSALGDHAPVPLHDAVDVRTAVVAVEVRADQGRDRATAVDVAADDRAPAVVVRRLDDRVARAGRLGAVELVRCPRAAFQPQLMPDCRRAARSRSPRTRPGRRRRSRDRRLRGRTRSATGCAGRTSRSRRRRPARPTNGLSAGMLYGALPTRFGSMRRILPSGTPRFWPLSCGSPALPPSPKPM